MPRQPVAGQGGEQVAARRAMAPAWVVLVLMLLLAAAGPVKGGLTTGGPMVSGPTSDGPAADGWATEGTPLTLQQAIQRAWLLAPALALAGLDVEEAELALAEAELGQWTGRSPREIEEALRGLQDARDAYIDGLAQTAVQVEEAYYNVLRARDGFEIQQSNHEQARRRFALTEARHRAGLVSRQEYMEAKLSRDESERLLNGARIQHEEAEGRLRRLVGAPEGSALVLGDAFPFVPWDGPLDEAVAEALEHRTEILRARQAVAQAQTRVRQAAATHAAPVEQQRAAINMARAELELAQRLDVVADQVRSEWFGLADLQQQVEMAARREALALTRVEISRIRYDAGAIALLELLQDEEAYAHARHAAVAAVWDYNLARARFIGTLGRTQLPPLPEPMAAMVAGWDGPEAHRLHDDADGQRP